MDHEWTVTLEDGSTHRVHADGWQLSAAGDLALVNDPYGARPFFVRAFAKGQWLEISLFA